MSKENFHIDDNFIPEGLEFREEYMHAALNSYKRTKRIIAFKRAAFVVGIILLITGASIAWLSDTSKQKAEVTHSAPNEQMVEHTSEQSAQPKELNEEASSTYDLGKDEQGFYKNGQIPAVESSEPTQDQSTKAVDMGGSMSSGVGLPGQLSNPKISKNEMNLRKSRQVESQNSPKGKEEISETGSIATLNHTTAQTTHPEEAASIDLEKNLQLLPYRPFTLFDFEHSLAPARPMQLPQESDWYVFATAGINVWSDFAFHHSPFKLDGSAAVGIGYKLKKKVSAEMNAHFFTVSGNAAPYVAIQRQFGDGFNETSYRYFTKRIYQTGLSALVKYAISPRHSFGAGWSTDYLLTADNHIETGVASSYENPTSNSATDRGYVKGYRTIQHALLLNYEYALGKNKSVGVQYQQGFTDFTKNEFFGNTRDKNSMLSIYYRIKLKS